MGFSKEIYTIWLQNQKERIILHKIAKFYQNCSKIKEMVKKLLNIFL